MSDEIIVHGPTVEEAVAKALRRLGVRRGDVTVTVEDEPRRGVLGLGARPARVRVRLRPLPEGAGADAVQAPPPPEPPPAAGPGPGPGALPPPAPQGEAASAGPDPAPREEGAAAGPGVSAGEPALPRAAAASDPEAASEPEETAQPGAAATQAAAAGLDPPAGGPAAEVPEEAGEPSSAAAFQGVDGTVALRNGRVVITPPEGSGRPPIVRPGNHVRVMVNGEVITSPRALFPGDMVEVSTVDVEPRRDVEVEIEPDGLTAYATVQWRAGRRFALRQDAPPSRELLLSAVVKEEVPVAPLTADEVRDAIVKAQVLPRHIDMEAVARAVANPGERVAVAFGRAPVLPQDGRVELLFEEERQATVDMEADRVDYWDRGEIPSVQVGERIALRHPPRPGQPGESVTGRPIPVRAPRDVKLKAGQGVGLSEDGSEAFAENAGRPSYTRGQLSVVPVYVVAGDVNVETGHVRFDGDVRINGDVTEQMQVKAGGRVDIRGLVSGAQVEANDGVTVNRSIIRAVVSAGGDVTLYTRLLTVMAPLRAEIGRLAESVGYVKGQARVQEAAGGRGDGILIKALLERRHTRIPTLAAEWKKLVAESSQETLGKVYDAALRFAELFQGLGPLQIPAVEELAALGDELGSLIEDLQLERTRTADVIARYIQNSRVRASGRVLLRGGACYQAEVVAGTGLQMKSGAFRGGSISVHEGEVHLDEVGTPTGTRTTVEIARKGVITARRVYPNVQVSIGGQIHVFEQEQSMVKVHVGADGHLELGLLVVSKRDWE